MLLVKIDHIGYHQFNILRINIYFMKVENSSENAHISMSDLEGLF